MGFYGNITNTSHTHFQFDKIFENRAAMDRAVQSGSDGIFTGRFVLVKYDPQSKYFLGDMLQGYLVGENVYSSIVHGYGTYVEYENPVYVVKFNLVRNKSAADWNSYYTYNGYYYWKLPAANYYSDEETYYEPVLNYPNATGGAISLTAEDNIVSLNTIIRVRDPDTAEPTGTFLQCYRNSNDDNAVFGKIATWREIIVDQNYPDYLTNYQIDQATYGDDFDVRGYDATVWEKVYSEGVGRFVPIARLSGSMPALELYAEPPSVHPSAPYIDSKSTDALYRIHVPSHWGFRIKAVEPTGPDLNEYPLSDQVISQEYKDYDNDNNVTRTYQDEIHAEIYFNKRADNKFYDYTDLSTSNRINIEPNGASGKHYWDKNGNPISTDTYELSVHLPMIGNMVADGYNLIYGVPEDQETLQRATDIEWYDGTETDEVKYNGNSGLGGKTHALNTLAGSLNTMHDIMGQIVVELESWPNEAGIEALSEQYLYTFDNRYYRRGTSLIKTIIQDSEYTFTVQANVPQADFILNKYYYQDGSVWKPATQWSSSLQNNGYALRNINAIRYTRVPLLLQYQSGQYYLKEGENYKCDNAAQVPTYPNRTYYQVSASLAGRNHDGHFTGEYVSDGRYFTRDAKGNYIPSLAESQLVNTTYYGVTVDRSYQGRRYYHPGSFYYKEGDSFYLEEDDNYHDDREYYVLIFGDTPKYGYGVNGQVIQYYEIAYEPEPVTQFHTMPVPSSQLYVLDDGKYIAYDNIKDLEPELNRDPYTIARTYYTLNIVSYAGDLYLPGVYYIKQNDNSYERSYDQLDTTQTYYIINSATPLSAPFYIPDKYYYKVSNDVYELARTTTMQYSGTSYYKKSPLYVHDDTTGTCPYGYEWSDYAAYIPPSITLYSAETRADLIQLPDLGKETNSLFGLLLRLNVLYGPGDEETRNIDTVRGAYNKLQDMLYQIKTLRPGQMLYVNEFGQIDSITLSKLKTLLANA